MKTLLIATVLFLAACPKPPEPTPTPTPSPTVSPSATITPTPTIAGTPAKCPCLVRWGIGKTPHVSVDANENQVQPPVKGGRVVFDTTQKFERFPGDTAGGACDNEQDNCSGRKCQDLRGPIFTVTGPSTNWRVNPTNNFQVKINQLQSGKHTITVKPRPDLQDAQGVAVQVCPQAASGGSDQAVMDVK